MGLRICLWAMALIGIFVGSASPADYRNQPLTAALLASGITIVDIRSEPEWQETGVVPGAVLLTFYRRDRSYDLEGFIAELRRHVEPQVEFALLCRRGNRSARVAAMLAGRGYSSIINLSGGIQDAARNGIRLEPYSGRSAP